ncbi:PhoD-like phosphatase N-terminal domain-containing protein [Streptomyces mexicanus]|uniref:PhoD-like phosphatase N-terminal domain-containing protein n=1 Tax=Streptomyces mexicanus TaxID=178566 RepID=UPI003019CCB4
MLAFPGAASARSATTALRADPFTLGVASGDPLPDSVVLWTRLAPDPLDTPRCPPARSRCTGRSRRTNTSGGWSPPVR